jgi:uncharacterized protein (TIGR02147 family)
MQLYDYTDYRLYLKTIFSGAGAGRGRRTHLAQYLNCQPSFLSQVFTDRAHLSLEHSLKTCDFLNFDEKESDYFMLLVSKAKSGSKGLEQYYSKKISKIKNEREEISKRIKVETNLDIADQMTYYSVWYYSAIHICVSIPGYDTVEKISDYLGLNYLVVKNALNFLFEKGFVKYSDDKYVIDSKRIHLKDGTPMLPRHHANWRIKAMEAIDQNRADELHYTAILGISKADKLLFKQRLLDLVEEFEPIIVKSKEEVETVLLLDLFNVGKQ